MYKILVVDDEELICKSLKALIERINIPNIGDIVLANCGFEAEKLIHEIKPHIVITDIRMPDIDGITLIQNALKNNKHLQFIVISGHDEFQYAKEAMKLGVINYLLKPVVTDELKETLEKTVEILRDKQNLKNSQEAVRYGNSQRGLEVNSREGALAVGQHIEINSSDKTAIDVAIRYIKENYNKDINMAVVANMVSMSYCYFSKSFKEQTGMNFVDYLTRVRMEVAKKLLNNPLNKINEVAVKVGYDRPKNFTRAFRNSFGKTPKEYRIEQNILKD